MILEIRSNDGNGANDLRCVMKSVKDNYKASDIVNCELCKKDIYAQDMFRYRDYIYCGYCIDDAAMDILTKERLE
jgi:hypothetical protein